MTLVELPASAAIALVEQVVGRDPRLAGLRRRVAERSGGNPFFAEELVRSLVEEGALIGKPGQRAPGPGGRGQAAHDRAGGHRRPD